MMQQAQTMPQTQEEAFRKAIQEMIERVTVLMMQWNPGEWLHVETRTTNHKKKWSLPYSPFSPHQCDAAAGMLYMSLVRQGFDVKTILITEDNAYETTIRTPKGRNIPYPMSERFSLKEEATFKSSDPLLSLLVCANNLIETL